MAAERTRAGALLPALPTLVFPATFGVFFLGKNREARTVLSSGRGRLVLVAMAGGHAAMALLLRRLARQAWVAPVLGPGWTVLVWCGAFSVPVANANQTA